MLVQLQVLVLIAETAIVLIQVVKELFALGKLQKQRVLLMNQMTLVLKENGVYQLNLNFLLGVVTFQQYKKIKEKMV